MDNNSTAGASEDEGDIEDMGWQVGNDVDQDDGHCCWN